MNKLLLSAFAFIEALILAGIFYLGAVVFYDPAASMLENTVALSYSISDMILIIIGTGLVLMSLEYRKGKIVEFWIAFLLGILCTLVADVLYTLYQQEYELGLYTHIRLLDTLWIAGYLFLAYALGFFGLLIRNVQNKVKLL